jgi:hypothetical protein
MRSMLIPAAAAAAVFMPFVAQADGLGYSYVEGAYVSTHVDGVSNNADGFALAGSMQLPKHVFAFAGYADQSRSGIKDRNYNLGAGYAWSLAPKADLYGKLGYIRRENRWMGSSASANGLELGVGVRARVIEQLELEGSVNYADWSKGGDDTWFGLAGRWHFSNQLSAGLSAAFGDDAKTYGLNARWTFAH